MNTLKIVDIHYVQSSGLCQLSEQVSKFIKAGYQPFGPVSVEEKYCGYIQTMVLYEDVGSNPKFQPQTKLDSKV